MRVMGVLLVAIAFAGCTGAGHTVPDDGASPTGDGAQGTMAGPDGPAGAQGSEWTALAAGLVHNGTGPTALVAEVRLTTTDDCELSVAAEYTSTGVGLQFMTQYRESDGNVGATGSFHQEEQAVQAGPVDTRSGQAPRSSASRGGFSIDDNGTLFIGVIDAQQLADVDEVPVGTVQVTSTCPGAEARWAFAGTDPVFFTTDSTDGELLLSAHNGALGASVAGARAFSHTFGDPGTLLVAQASSLAPAGVLQLASPAGTQTWNLATDRFIWHEGPGGQQDVSLHQAGPSTLLGVLFGKPVA